MKSVPYNEPRGDSVEEIIFDKRPLSEQFFCSESLPCLDDSVDELEVDGVRSTESLESFLNTYKEKLLLPIELPAILQAYTHASRHETRELIEFDQHLLDTTPFAFLARASIRSGQSRLRRLRPLRDQRLVRRYLEAVEEGRAHGWHSLVFGISLALYSVPVRQGMLGYARQTLNGFLNAAPYVARFSNARNDQVLDQLLEDLPGRIEEILKQSHGAVTEPGILTR